MKNNSPWLHQLQHTRTVDKLASDVTTDIAILGAGIAGVMTAYFTLRDTDKKVMLIEGYKVAHGSTGHNAGQLVAEFEREFFDMVEEFGLEKTAEAEIAMRGAWTLLEEVFVEAKLTTPMSTFLGYDGYANITRVLEQLKNNVLRSEAGIPTETMYIAKDAPGLADIPRMYKDFYNVVDRDNILSLLESFDDQYIAAIPTKKGCVNSALMVEEIVGYLLTAYKDRFTLVEHTQIKKIQLRKDDAVLHGETNTITCGRVVLCTNGFKKFTIEYDGGEELNTDFHQEVQGAVAYMAGYLEELNHPPVALSYYDAALIQKGHAKDVYHEEPYIYVTRRPYELEKNEHHNLVCIGGPEVLLEDTTLYEPDSESPEDALNKIDKFLHQTYTKAPHNADEYQFRWHGLMCYTPNGMRLVGVEPRHHALMYNLGCNGVGILPSTYGGKRISELLSGNKVASTLFDPSTHTALS